MEWASYITLNTHDPSHKLKVLGVCKNGKIYNIVYDICLLGVSIDF